MMNTILVGLSLVAAASAQWGEVAASGYASASPTPASYDAGCVSSGGSGCGDASASSSSSASSSTITAAPSSSSAYDQGYYTSFMNGGYSSMDCGYGYQKDSKGACTQQSWVRHFIIFLIHVRLF
jgi:hypothetical protein